MANTATGKFEVDVTALKLAPKDLAGLDKAIQKAVLSHLVGLDAKAAFPRIFGRPGHTDGIRIMQSDLKQF